jgi:hypothetical protein
MPLRKSRLSNRLSEKAESTSLGNTHRGFNKGEGMQKSAIIFASIVTCVVASAMPAFAATNELRSTIPIPASCKVTTVYGSDLPSSLPWIVAQPRFQGLRMVLASEQVGRGWMYTPIPAGGTDVFVRGPAGSVQVSGYYGESRTSSYTRLMPTSGTYQSLLLPKPGCWHLRLQSGAHTAWITLWARPHATGQR